MCSESHIHLSQKQQVYNVLQQHQQLCKSRALSLMNIILKVLLFRHVDGSQTRNNTRIKEFTIENQNDTVICSSACICSPSAAQDHQAQPGHLAGPQPPHYCWQQLRDQLHPKLRDQLHPKLRDQQYPTHHHRQ